MSVKFTAKVIPLLAALLLAACVAPQFVNSTAGKHPGAEPGAEVARLVNLQRKKAGLPPLRVNSHLKEATATHAGAMARHDCFKFDCGGHTVSERLSYANYRAQSSDFYLGAGFTSPEQLVRQMMSSARTREMILNPRFHHVGAATHGRYWIVGFAAPALEDIHAIAQQVTNLVNKERKKHGLVQLTLNPLLGNSAMFHANFMADNDCFEHLCPGEPELGQRARAAGYNWFLVAENIAAGSPTPAAVMDGWMKSPGHRANILNPDLREIGIGYVLLDRDGGNEKWRHYWVQNFGHPKGS